MCGVIGMKPTYGLVSRRGVVPLAFSLDHVGTLTRTVRDNALMLDLIAGYDAQDPGSANHSTGGAAGNFAAQLGRDIKGLRVGVLRHFYTRDMQADPDIANGIEAAATRLAELGATVREIATAPLDEARYATSGGARRKLVGTHTQPRRKAAQQLSNIAGLLRECTRMRSPFFRPSARSAAVMAATRCSISPQVQSRSPWISPV